MRLRTAFLTILVALLTIYFWSADGPQDSSKAVVSDLQRTALSYAAQPRFAGNGIFQGITDTDAQLEKYDLEGQQVYVSFPGDSTQLAEALPKITTAPGSVDYADWENGRWELGNYLYRDRGRYFFRFSASELNVSADTEITQWFTEEVRYSIRVSQLSNYISNKPIYGGPTSLESDAVGRPIPNHGALITRGQLRSLQQLAGKIVSADIPDERAAQKLLNFVTRQIEYDHAEAGYSVETLKRAPEVLLSGSSDCSGTVILYASLLEQIGIDYVLVYMPTHIAVAVEGDFTNQNGYTISWRGKQYSIAETTVEGFLIGRSRIADESQYDFEYLQQPGGDQLVAIR